VDFLKVGLGMHLENVITALFLLPDVYDAMTLHEALEVRGYNFDIFFGFMI
jgi:hypothetical protein